MIGNANSKNNLKSYWEEQKVNVLSVILWISQQNKFSPTE